MTIVAVLGFGSWGQNLIRCFDTLCEVAYGCHTGDQSNANWLNDHYPTVTLTTSYDRILEDDEVDAVVIATPVKTHARLAARAIRSGKHVFVEKPLAHGARYAQHVAELADEFDRKLFTGYIFIYAPAVRLLVDYLQNDPPVHISATWKKFGSFEAPIEQSLVCHDVALGHWLFGDPFTRTSVVERTAVRTRTDVLSAIFEADDGRTMRAAYDRTANEKRKSIIVTSKSRDRYEIINNRLLKVVGEDHQDLTPPDLSEPLAEECSSFINWIEGGNEPPTAGRFGVGVDRVLGEL